ncbi:MAG TPA: ferritin [Gemmatimonadaceae bacterium]|nr:ferritin [Gemmatimonadaceae bacterium]
MLISNKMNDALNEQIGHEFGASIQYVAIAAHFDSEGLPTLARHFYKQATEEREHAMRFVKFTLDADGRVQIPAIPAPRSDFGSAEEAVQLSLDWEKSVTKQINGLMDQAIKENDHITQNFLQWFMNEQLEEVSSMDTLLRLVRRAGEKGLLFVENYLQGLHPTSLTAEARDSQ